MVGQGRLVHALDQRIVPPGADAVAQHDRREGIGLEPLPVVDRDAARGAEQVDLVLQRVGHLHVGAIAPEFGIRAVRELVVQDDEVAHEFVALRGQAVEFVGQFRAAVAVGEVLEQPADRQFDDVDARRFERFEEAARQAHRHAVLDPRLAPPARREAQLARGLERLGVHAVQQHAPRLLVRHESVAVHVAVAVAVLQRDAPLPARGLRRRPRVRREAVGQGAGHGLRAVTGQHGAPVLVAGLVHAFDQQAAEARAIDEQVALDAAAVLQLQGRDEARFRMLLDVADRALDALHAARRRVLAQVQRIQARIELERIGVGIGGAGLVAVRRHEPVLVRHHRRDRPFFVRRHIRVVAREAQPDHEGRTVLDRRAEIAETVEEAVAEVAPVAEVDAQLERGLRAPDEIRPVDAERVVVVADRRQRGLPHADGADLRRLDEDDLARPAQLERERRRGHPAGGTAAHDDDFTDGLVGHGVLQYRNAGRK
ncbi:conserved hypothetical protein, partial [Ricinus communis]